jgi:threonine synthase
MNAKSLTCRECGFEYPLEARYVCERCFGPVEVAYDFSGIAGDPESLRRRIQAGPQNIWRYADFLPVDALPVGAHAGLPVGSTPLVKAARCGSRTTPTTPRTPSRIASSPSHLPGPASSG